MSFRSSPRGRIIDKLTLDQFISIMNAMKERRRDLKPLIKSELDDFESVDKLEMKIVIANSLIEEIKKYAGEEYKEELVEVRKLPHMWREEIGLMEMLLAYIGEFEEFDGWSSWRNVLIDILSCHEDLRQQRLATVQAIIEEVPEEKKQKECEVADCSLTSNEPLSTCPDEEPDKKELYDVNVWQSDTHSEQSGPDIKKQIEGESSTMDSQFANKCANVPLKVEPDLMQENITNFSIDSSQSLLPKPDEDDEEESEPFAPFAHPLMNPNAEKTLSSGVVPLPSRSIFGHSSKATSHTWRSSHRTERNIVQAGRGIYKCGYSHCGKTFEGYANAKRHTMTHSGERPYSCSICNMTFTQLSNKTRHERTHSGEKPHLCGYCLKAFTRRSDRIRHERTHLRPKPVKVPYVEQSF